MDIPHAYGDPPLGYRFLVVFLIGGVVPNPFDVLFQKVSGLESSIDLETVAEGGQNLYAQRLPKQVQYGNLRLERGVMVGSPLVIEFNVAMSRFQFSPSNVLVTLLNDAGIPLAGWLFMKAYPVRWSVSDLDATANQVAIEQLELAYQQMQVLRI
jgi:phage tail-like protein